MATPTITDVTVDDAGAFSTGAVLTITGTNLQDEDKTNWDSDVSSGEDSFEGSFNSGFPTSDGWSTGGDDYSTSVKLFGSQSLHWQRTGSGSQSNTIYRDGLSTTNGNFFCRLYLRCDFSTVGDGSFANDSDKIMLWYGESVFNNYNFIQNGGSTAYTGLQIAERGGGWNPGTFNDGVLKENKWYCHEIEIPGSSPWNWRVWINGDAISGLNPLVGSGDPQQSPFDSVWEENTHHNSNANFGFDKYLDGCVVSTSRVYPACKVEISDTSDFSGTIVYQYPESISNTSVDVECDLTGLSGGSYYMRVTNGQNTESAIFDLTGGGGGTAGIASATQFRYFR